MLRKNVTIDVVICQKAFDFRLRDDTKMAVSIGQRQTKTERCSFQSTVIIALLTNARPFLFKQKKKKPLIQSDTMRSM